MHAYACMSSLYTSLIDSLVLSLVDIKNEVESLPSNKINRIYFDNEYRRSFLLLQLSLIVPVVIMLVVSASAQH